MKFRPVAASTAAAGLVLGSAGLAAASSTGATSTPAPTAAPHSLLSALRTAGGLSTQSTDVVGDQTVRLSGPDRYATSVEVSSSSWDPEDTFAVVLASGEGFADALSAGPLASGAGPLLLTQRDALPPVVAAEIGRLQPCFVVVVGGTASVSARVAAQADALADSTSTKCTDATG